MGRSQMSKPHGQIRLSSFNQYRTNRLLYLVLKQAFSFEIDTL